MLYITPAEGSWQLTVLYGWHLLSYCTLPLKRWCRNINNTKNREHDDHNISNYHVLVALNLQPC